MLVARRDPFHPGASDNSLSHAVTTPHHAGTGFARALTVLQLAGALVAIPVGIGSVYSTYQSTFSPEATCKSLRVNIVRMLDKNVDAGTRHMLVRRDVEVFERTCGAFDPDATAAFKSLLAAEKAPAATMTVPRADSQTVVQQLQTVVRTVEPAPKAKQTIARAPGVATAPVQNDAPVSDTAWLAAVRGALVSHERDSASAATPATAVPRESAAPPRVLGELRVMPKLLDSPLAAPALPPAAAVARVPTLQVDPDHPVPPAAIPETMPVLNQNHSRFDEWVAQIPIVGRTLIGSH